MNKFILGKKNIAFTLAEMMVVLALFSVVSAATLPVITARQQISSDGSGGSAFVGSASDPWKYSDTNKILYYNVSAPMNRTAAVMVGRDIVANSLNLGYPSLIVSDMAGKEADVHNSSQIIFLKRNGDNPYYAGRIATPKESKNSFAIGSNALMFDDVQANRYGNVAIGSNAMNLSSLTPTYLYSNVAIGENTLIAKNKRAYGTVAIGSYAANGFSAAYGTVAIGNSAGSMGTLGTNTGVVLHSVNIGNYSGYVNYSSDGSIKNNVAVGNYAGSFVTGYQSTALGYYAGSSISVAPSSTIKNYYDALSIGTYAGVINSPLEAISSGIAIGTYASYLRKSSNIAIGEYASAEMNSGGSISIGTRAGFHEYYQTINIGAYAGAFSNSRSSLNVPVYIGTYAGYATGQILSSVAMGYYAAYNATAYYNTDSIFIGMYSGANSTSVRTNTICIGPNSCYGNYAAATDVRITKRGTLRPSTGATATRYMQGGFSHIGDVPQSLYKSTDDYTKGFGAYSSYMFNSNYGTLLLSPLSESESPDSTNSAIVLYGDVFSSKNILYAASDRRLKKNIKPAKYGLNEVRKINVYNYTWKSDKTNTPQIGVIAQEMQKIIPESVTKGDDGYFTVNVTWYIYTMVNAIKEVNAHVENLQKSFVAYKKEFTTLLEQVNNLEKEVNNLEKENRELTRQINVAYKKVQSRK